MPMLSNSCAALLLFCSSASAQELSGPGAAAQADKASRVSLHTSPAPRLSERERQAYEPPGGGQGAGGGGRGAYKGPRCFLLMVFA